MTKDDCSCSIMGEMSQPTLIESIDSSAQKLFITAFNTQNNVHPPHPKETIENYNPTLTPHESHVLDKITGSNGKLSMKDVSKLLSSSSSLFPTTPSSSSSSSLSKARDQPTSAVLIRRHLTLLSTNTITTIPLTPSLDYASTSGRNCDNCIGYIPIPLGVAGPLLLSILDSSVDGGSGSSGISEVVSVNVPLATTEGGLIASISRGLKVIRLSSSPSLNNNNNNNNNSTQNHCKGVVATVLKKGITRSPLLQFNSLKDAIQFRRYIDRPSNIQKIKYIFNSTSRYAKLVELENTVVGNLVYLKFRCESGDAMGMNMVSKGVEFVVGFLLDEVCDGKSEVYNSVRKRMEGEGEGERGASYSGSGDHVNTKPPLPMFKLITLSSNMCTDKKPSSTNFTSGRGHSITTELTIPSTILKTVLRTTASRMSELSFLKNQIGSSLSGSIGGSNAHAANVVAAVYLATGQDPAHVVEGCMCTTIMRRCGLSRRSKELISRRAAAAGGDGDFEEEEEGEEEEYGNDESEGEDLYISCTLPSIIIGTLGGGTEIQSQQSCLQLLNCAGATSSSSSEEASRVTNSERLACIIAGTVMAGEISLISALAEGELVGAHMKLNRKREPVTGTGTNTSASVM